MNKLLNILLIVAFLVLVFLGVNFFIHKNDLKTKVYKDEVNLKQWPCEVENCKG